MMRSAAEVDQLFNENVALYYSCLHSFVRKYRNVSPEDVAGIVGEYMTRALYRHDPRRGKLSTIVYTSIDNAILKHINEAKAKKRQATVLSLTWPICKTTTQTYGDVTCDPNDSEEEAIERAQIKLWLGRLDDRDRQIAAMRYQGLTTQEIGARLGISRERVGQRLRIMRNKYDAIAKEKEPPGTAIPKRPSQTNHL